MRQRIGDFEVLNVLGEGTVGTVYHARHRETGQIVAIKLLKEHLARDPALQQRFVREIAISEQLDHPHIVRHHDCGLDGDQIYFAMELVTGGTLKDVVRRRGRLPWREACEVARQVTSALDYAHQRGVIHRDLKPGNLFLADDSTIKIGDFGLARDLGRVRLTLEGTTVGTCRYMPPEQIVGDDELTGGVDLYALGCILFEMLSGKPPFDGATIVEIFEQHLNVPPPDLVRLVPDCPPDLARQVGLLLAKDPRDRPASAAVVHQALTDILQGRPMTLGADVDDSIDIEVSTEEYETSNLTERLRSGPSTSEFRVSGRQWLVIAIALAAVIVVVVIAARI